jgi:putative IMPACT (imprinted ancient) family translation regulator
LIRAYSQAAKLALDNTKIKIKVFTQLITLKFSYELENLVRNTINEFKGSIGSSDYSDHIVMDVKIPQSKHGLFREKLTELSNSTIKIIMAE